MPKRATEKLTKRLIDALQPRPDKDFTVWDREIAGFGIRVRETGAKSFVIKYRNAHGRQRKMTLGSFGALTPEMARRIALSEMAEVVQGNDPALTRRATKQASTVSELCDVYFKEASLGRILYRGTAKRPSTLQIDKGRIERHIKPLLGDKPIGNLTRRDIETFMFAVRDGATAIDQRTGPRGRARVRGGQGTAVKAVNLLSTIFNFAIKRGWGNTNPCHGVEKPADGRRERFLNAGEYSQLGIALEKAVQQDINPTAITAIRFAALTGCRKGEVLSLKVSEVDFVGHCLRFGETKTGPQMRPCGAAAFEHLQAIKSFSANDWFFPTARNQGHLTDIARPVLKVRELAALPDLTLHVLRHSFATVAHEIGYSELTIAGLLGHAQGTVTSRYAHHVDHALSAAADRVSETIAERMMTLPCSENS
jgi:integrase